MADLYVDTDVDSEKLGDTYMCNNCSTKFWGVGKNIHCPLCSSSQVRRDID